VVDATFSRREYRAPFVDAAARLELPYYVVHVTAPDPVIRERLAARATDPTTHSDADLEVYEQARKTFEPPDETPGGHVVRILSGTGFPEEQSSKLLDRRIRTEGD
jgi:predicted kinase